MGFILQVGKVNYQVSKMGGVSVRIQSSRPGKAMYTWDGILMQLTAMAYSRYVLLPPPVLPGTRCTLVPSR